MIDDLTIAELMNLALVFFCLSVIGIGIWWIATHWGCADR